MTRVETCSHAQMSYCPQRSDVYKTNHSAFKSMKQFLIRLNNQTDNEGSGEEALHRALRQDRILTFFSIPHFIFFFSFKPL